MSYTEFPTDRIIDVRFKKKPDDRPPSPCQPGSELCNTYGYGVKSGFASAGIISALPVNAFPPFSGTFSTVDTNGPKGIYGGLQQPPSASVPTVMTAAPFGLIATSMFLDYSDFTFTNQQLMQLVDQQHNVGTYRWFIPMAQGSALDNPTDKFSDCIPILVDTYTINVEWSGSFGGHTCGIGIQHPIPGFSGILVPPSEPVAIFSGGSGSYTYPWRWKEWALNEFHYDTSNQYSDALGGPAFLWWMTQQRDGSWSGGSQFMGSTIIGLGDAYRWDISCTCIKEPPLFLPGTR